VGDVVDWAMDLKKRAAEAEERIRISTDLLRALFAAAFPCPDRAKAVRSMAAGIAASAPVVIAGSTW
jgi:hypothetical protein